MVMRGRGMSASQKRQMAMCYLIFVMNGMLALSIGSLLPYIRDARGLDYAFCGLIVSLHSVGNLVSSFVAGALPLVLGRKKSILLFNIFYPLSYLAILRSDSGLLLAAAFFATGVARGATSNYCNNKINSIATGKAWALNALHACFALGAFLFPLILLFLTRSSDARWVTACGLMMAAGCASWILYLLIPEPEDRVRRSGDSAGASRADAWGFFREPIFYLCLFTLFFYLCAEQGVIGWMITYFKDTGLIGANLSQLTASVLWVMILLGRLTVAFLSTRHPKENLLPVMGIGIVAFFIVLLVGRSIVPIMIGIMGFGFSMAGIYATTVSFAGRLIRDYSLAWSFLLTGASLGAILMPSVIGAVASRAGIAAGMSTIALALVVDMAFILLLVRYVRAHRESVA